MTIYKSLVDQSVCREEMWAWNLLVASVSARRPQNENMKLKTVVVAYWESIDPTAENTRTQRELKTTSLSDQSFNFLLIGQIVPTSTGFMNI